MNFDNAIDKKSNLDTKLIEYNTSNPNHKVLELTKNSDDDWNQYKKQGGVFAHHVERKTYIKSLENRTGQETAKKGDWILMGIEKEQWVIDDKTFKKKYIPGETNKKASDSEDREFTWYNVNPGSAVAALRMHVPFKVMSSWSDEPLHGKSGDYIVKNFADINNPDPKDVWLVDGKIFNKTYKKVL